MKERIEQLEQELAELKKQLVEPEFEVGDWVINERNVLINIQDQTNEGISGFGFLLGGKWTDDTNWDTIKKTQLRKATPEEIESALIEEAKRRYSGSGKIKYLDGRFGDLYGFGLFYDINNDSLTASGMSNDPNNRSDILYQNGKWAEVIEEKKKFFEWSVDYPENPFDIELVTIGCTQFDKNFLVKMEHALGYLTDYSVQEVVTELEKLDL